MDANRTKHQQQHVYKIFSMQIVGLAVQADGQSVLLQRKLCNGNDNPNTKLILLLFFFLIFFSSIWFHFNEFVCIDSIDISFSASFCPFHCLNVVIYRHLLVTQSIQVNNQEKKNTDELLLFIQRVECVVITSKFEYRFARVELFIYTDGSNHGDTNTFCTSQFCI